MATKLLLVEDSLSIQTIVGATFAQAGFEVMVAGDALEGLQKAQTWLPDIVLADASMPGLDGFQLCQRIRHSASGRHVPVVLLTSGFAAYDEAKGDRAGVTTHLAKPFEPPVLLELVTQLVPGGRPPAYHSPPVAAILPRTTGEAFEASGPGPREHEESATNSPARPSMERVEGLAVTRSSAAEMDSDLLGDAWREAAFSPNTAELALAAETAPGGSAGVASAAAPAIPGTPPTAGSEAIAFHMLSQTLGQHLLQMLREALEAHLTTTLTQLMPHMLDAVRDVVQAQMPTLLEALLQQEIAQLKHAIEQDQHDA